MPNLDLLLFVVDLPILKMLKYLKLCKLHYKAETQLKNHCPLEEFRDGEQLLECLPA